MPVVKLEIRRPHVRQAVMAALAVLAMASQAAPVGAPPAKDVPVPAAPPAVAPQDPVMSLLAEKGLLKPAEGTLVQTVRDTASELVLTAMNFLGVPYRRGGNSESSGFDCSGFTRYIFEHSLGRVLPRRSDEQARDPDLQKVARDELKPGDLVFFNTMRRTFSHVGIYIGEDKFIHSPRAGGQVRVEDMRDGYWARRFTGARRADLNAAAAAATTDAPPRR